jgi:hypothetical protein
MALAVEDCMQDESTASNTAARDESRINAVVGQNGLVESQNARLDLRSAACRESGPRGIGWKKCAA